MKMLGRWSRAHRLLILVSFVRSVCSGILIGVSVGGIDGFLVQATLQTSAILLGVALVQAGSG